MKLHCNVEVHNRALLSMSQRKSQRSVLTIGKQSDKDDLYIFLQTLQNKKGTKYKTRNNVEKVFTRFIDDGKATIRLKEPSHDLIIQSEAIQLKSFLRVLKLGLFKVDQSSFPIISNLSLKNMGGCQNNKLVIKKDSDYPVLKGFPKMLEELSVLGLKKKSFDRQILNLQFLRVLNLSNNQITSLPKEVGCMPHLRELLISQNHLGRSQSKWKWIDQAAIKKNLHLLDISSNVISELPVQIGALDALVKLQIYQNLLKNLPQSIGRLRNLKHLEAARNCLSHLPGSMRNLQLDYLDLSSNPFLVYRRNTLYRHMHMTASLVECAAVAFLKTRIPYDAGMLPRTLVQYLDNATYCSVCANGCFNRFIMGYLEIELRRISCQTKITANATILFECYFCSNKCIRYF
ncbi:leucine-rich repeat protein 1 isoform X1 [Harpegnathos saltator]|uniref:Peptidylprolyl isomerase-like 5 n=1 Tax=Harpegnathos saltator TaxID=610380 RepID=E2C6Q4_HARSA|nr:leucine-rich repeat protein 1 isoform X1 [Harpegnathos saltator]EFN76366.1 Peptidylprolyl isomerase-like 5 [Harpegnathos saltator]